MPTFLSIVDSFPRIEEERFGVKRHVGVFTFFCLVTTLVLLAAAYYWQQRALIYAVFVPLSLMVVGFLVGVFIDVRDERPFFKNPGAYLAKGLDTRFAQEKVIAAELAATDLVELKRMRTRLEADMVRTERWLDVLKPISMLAPAVLLLISVGLFRLPGVVQDICKVFFAAATVGAIVAAIPIYEGLVKFRTLLSTLQYAIELAEENKKPQFRKVSRKRRLA